MAKKRAVGEGTIYQRKDGRWEVAIKSVTTVGTRKRIRQYASTRAEAVEKLDELRRQIRRGTPMSDKNWRLGEYLEYWLVEIVKPNKRFNTYAQCERTVRLYLKPGFGNLRLNGLTVRACQDFLSKKLAEDYSISNVQVMKKVLSAALTNAMREDLIARNPARLVILPTDEFDDREPWSVEEARQFLEAAQTERLYSAFLLLLIDGLRSGEVRGLVWRDVDLTKQVVRLRRQLQRSDHGLQLAPLKTKASKTDLPLVDETTEALREHRSRQLASQQAEGSAWVGPTGLDGLVFPAEHSKPMEPSTLRRAFNRVCRDHNIRHVRLHDARDGLATLLDELGVSAKDMQGILRHSRVTTTLEHYVHGKISKQRPILREVGERLLPRKEKDDTILYRPSAERSRQTGRQNTISGSLNQWFVSGAGDGTLTRGLILGKGTNPAVEQRWGEIRSFLQRRTYMMLLGVVAVNPCRQKPTAQRYIALRVTTMQASCLHRRLIPSLRVEAERP